eukprot:TRINITY_DN1569_c0_g1_i3.p3 TRINITY_DN1569_c0_g1~~TRINITY_DN1569_c0_g1_i3.p3  ORF type:complete len:155 (-),score=8.53 TRINITY_DN1569_c0_g1_i3:8-472(-)
MFWGRRRHSRRFAPVPCPRPRGDDDGGRAGATRPRRSLCFLVASPVFQQQSSARVRAVRRRLRFPSTPSFFGGRHWPRHLPSLFLCPLFFVLSTFSRSEGRSAPFCDRLCSWAPGTPRQTIVAVHAMASSSGPSRRQLPVPQTLEPTFENSVVL